MNKEKVFDALLVLKCHEGDSRAFGLLVKRWNKKLISFAYKFTHEIESARDIAQESWYAAHKNLGKLHDPSKFSTWIYKLTYNKAIDHIRKLKKNEVNHGNEIAHEDHEILAQETDRWSTVNNLLQEMPEKHKTILTLFYLEQQTIKQVAEILQLSEGTVKSRIFYARELLKKKYKEVKK